MGSLSKSEYYVLDWESLTAEEQQSIKDNIQLWWINRWKDHPQREINNSVWINGTPDLIKHPSKTEYALKIPRSSQGLDKPFNDPILDTLTPQNIDVEEWQFSHVSQGNILITDQEQFTAFENFGPVSQGARVTGYGLLVDKDGKKWFTIYYRDGQIVVIDEPAVTYSYEDSGDFKPWKPIYSLDSHKIFWFQSAVESRIFIFDLVTKAFSKSPALDFIGVADRCKGTDSHIYFSTQVSSISRPNIYKYDTSNGLITSWNDVDANFNTFAFALGADSNHIYVIYRSGGDYWLVTLDQATGIATRTGTPEDEYKSGNIRLYKDTTQDRMFWEVILSSSTQGAPDLVLNIVDNIHDPTLNKDEDLQNSWQEGAMWNATYSPDNWPALFSIEADVTESAGVDGPAVFKYKDTGAPAFNEITIVEIQADPDKINDWDLIGSNFVGAIAQYGPVFIWNSLADTTDQLEQFEQCSVYGVLTYDSDTVYFSGYPNRVFEWKVNEAWTVGQYNLDDPLSNPRQITGVQVPNAFYYYYMAKGANGYVYFLYQKIRGASGVGYAWHNPSVGSGIATGTVIETLANYEVNHLATINDGLKLVTSTKSAASALLLIHDLGISENLDDITPLEIVLNSAFIPRNEGGIIFPVSTDIFCGITQNIFYKVDLINYTVNYYSLPSSQATGQQHPPDASQIGSKIYAVLRNFAGNDAHLYEIDPAAVTFKRISSSVRNENYTRKVLALTNSEFYFNGGASSIIQYNGENDATHLEKLT